MKEKYCWYYDLCFDNSIYKKDGAEFEKFFTQIMQAKDKHFELVKPYGNIGDEKCDGRNVITGDYYLCYAPENLQDSKTQTNAVKKIKDDISGILLKWNGIKKLHYAINDKFKGLPPHILHAFDEMRSLTNIDIEVITAETLRTIFYSIDMRDQMRILGFYYNCNTNDTIINYDVVCKIIKHIEDNYTNDYVEDEYIVPDMNEKMAYNKLSKHIQDDLKSAYYRTNQIDDFFDKNVEYNKQDLKDYMVNIYNTVCKEIPNTEEHYADKRFAGMIDKMMYGKNQIVVSNAIVIIASFFETCDIFEKPIKE